MEKEELRIHFQCSICLEICKDAIESTCCYSIFCETCSMPLRACPLCRSQQPGLRPSYVIRRIIGFMPASCELCGFQTVSSNMEAHLGKCVKAPLKCSFCDNSFIKETIVQHYMDTHPDELVKKFDENSKTTSACKRIGDKINSRGRKAKLGISGKYYCEGSLGAACECCDDTCGPSSGCNCSACMTLDIDARKLPKGYLVNSKGRAVRIGATGRIYCGCNVLKHVAMCDGFCGPTNGPNCKHCQQIQNIWDTRYRPITSQWNNRGK